MDHQSLKAGVVDYVARFIERELVATSKSLRTFMARPTIADKLALVDGRMVDQADRMLKSWREAAHEGGQNAPLPVVLVATSKDYASTSLSSARPIAQQKYMHIDGSGNRIHVRVDKNDLRVQVAFFCADGDTASSMVSQFKLYCTDFRHRYASAYFERLGYAYAFAMRVEDSNLFASNVAVGEQTNLTVLVVDLTFNCEIPYFRPPSPDDGLTLVKHVVLVKPDEVQRRHHVYASTHNSDAFVFNSTDPTLETVGFMEQLP
jgi:hypothetical protein